MNVISSSFPVALSICILLPEWKESRYFITKKIIPLYIQSYLVCLLFFRPRFRAIRITDNPILWYNSYSFGPIIEFLKDIVSMEHVSAKDQMNNNTVIVCYLHLNPLMSNDISSSECSIITKNIRHRYMTSLDCNILKKDLLAIYFIFNLYQTCYISGLLNVLWT